MNSRQDKSILLFLCLTGSGCILSFFILFGLFLHPLLFAIAMILTNSEYYRYKGTPYITVVAFCLIYLKASPPFYELGRSIGSEYIGQLSNCAAAFIMVILTVKLLFKDITIKIFQILIILGSIILCTTIVYLLKLGFAINLKNLTSEVSLFSPYAKLTWLVLIYQFFIVICLVSTMVNTRIQVH